MLFPAANMPESNKPSAPEEEIAPEFENVEISKATDADVSNAGAVGEGKESGNEGPGEGSRQPDISPEEQALKDLAATAGKV